MIKVITNEEYSSHLNHIERVSESQNPSFWRIHRHTIEYINNEFFHAINQKHLYAYETEVTTGKIYQIIRTSKINYGTEKCPDWVTEYSQMIIRVTRQTECFYMYQKQTYAGAFSTQECRIHKKNIVAVILD